jgi:hypothetical protein
MSKSLVRVLLVLGLAGFSYSQASAYTSLPRPFRFDVTWRTSSANSQGYVDSAEVAEGTVLAAQPADTTAPIPWPKFVTPPALSTVNGTDSIAYARFELIPDRNGVVVAAGDTVNISAQYSYDAVNWIAVTNAQAIAMLEPATAADAFYYTLKATSSAVAFWSPGVVSGTALTRLQLLQVPFVRFIINGDYIGRFFAKISGWTFDETNN